jgi:thymidylate synthase
VIPHPELQYLDLVRKIIEQGFYRPSPHRPLPTQPNPPGTYSLMNQNLAFDLSMGWFPLMTVRWMGLKGVVAELLWFLSGSTNNADLHALGAHLWDSWDTPETNQSLGWAPGQLGPIYGKQWRHWGARMQKPDGRLDGPGYDQIDALVRGIRETPHSKRLYVTGYDPADMNDCFVTTCHGLFFCQVWGDQLNLHMVQRSADVPVGVPFNIASYSLLLMMLAQVTGLKPGMFYITLSDAHLYENQVDSMSKVLTRGPYPYPQVRINPDVTNIFDFRPDDFELTNYQFHPKLKVPVAT